MKFRKIKVGAIPTKLDLDKPEDFKKVSELEIARTESGDSVLLTSILYKRRFSVTSGVFSDFSFAVHRVEKLERPRSV
jgi:hypothetical protein